MSLPMPGHRAAFDLLGPLPRGVTVLEASAGTGKTFTIAALAARFVAEGVRLEEILVVTFTRLATSELRERVRERLVSAEEGLRAVLAGAGPPTEDAVAALLARGAPEEVALRRRRLARALVDFDAATIATTHQFCHHVLGGLGVAGDVEREPDFREDLGGLLDEVIGDLYVRRFHHRGPEDITPAIARRVGREAVARLGARLEPADADPGSAPAMRRRLAEAVRAELERRKRLAGALTYDDLLTRLRDTLADPARGTAACARLRERYRLALVDEFQDTDPVQWEIVRRAFGEGDATLVLIGDPKQAIYAFRGADVHAYLEAARSAKTTATLDVNWRSDQPLIDAHDALFGGARLGHPEIAYLPVRAADGREAPGLRDAPEDAPLRIRVLPTDDPGVTLTPTGWVQVGTGRRRVAADVAADLVRLLSSPAQVGPPGGSEAVRPRHVAVLVRTNEQAGLVRQALRDVGVPAVTHGAGSALSAPAARDWLALLQALERPTSRARAASAALSTFLGWSAARLAAAGESDLEELHALLHRWAAVVRRRGVASLLESVSRTQELPARVLAREGGERELTDLRHLGRLLHAAAVEGQRGVSALAAWLGDRIATDHPDAETEEASRRLESDAEAVQVLTVHMSKGLQFPIVYVPYLWDARAIREDDIPVFHDPSANGRRTVDVGGKGGPGFDDHLALHAAEERGEDLRLAYVALTRARHQVVLWWAGGYEGCHSALARLLLARDAQGNVAAHGGARLKDPAALAAFRELAARAPGRIVVERVAPAEARSWDARARAGAPEPTLEPLVAGRFERALDERWRRTSYSAITAGVHASWDERVGSEPEAREAGADEAARPVGGEADRPPDANEAALRAVPSPLAELPAGMEVGTAVHAVLERTDFAAPDLEQELALRVAEQRAWTGVDLGEPTALVAGLAAAIATPLGPQLGDLCLRDVARSDRLDELSFELPLAGGEAPREGLRVEAIGALLAEHLPPGDPLAPYAVRLADPLLAHELRGFLAGTLDLVVRTRAADGTPRFAVLDHKTNWLAPEGEPLSAWHHRPAALAETMMSAHYALQALLYLAALHRYLRWRLPGYDPACHLAGVAYLFTRGMGGPHTPRVAGQPCGVFAWRPPPALVVALSDLLDAGAGPR